MTTLFTNERLSLCNVLYITDSKSVPTDNLEEVSFTVTRIN